MTEEIDILDDMNRLGSFANTTNMTTGDGGDISDDEMTFISENDSYIFIATAIFTICYCLMGFTCCRCYWLHLRKKSEHNRSTEGGLEAVVSTKDSAKRGSKDNNVGTIEPEEEINEFLEPKWS